MIRMESIGSTKPLDNLVRYATAFPRIVVRVAQAELNEPPTLLSQLQAYPPVPSGSRYRRTFQLQRGYQQPVLVVRGSEAFIEIRYVGERQRHLYVKGRRQTAKHRETGWRKDDEIVTDYMTGYRKRFTAALAVAAKALGRSG